MGSGLLLLVVVGCVARVVNGYCHGLTQIINEVETDAWRMYTFQSCGAGKNTDTKVWLTYTHTSGSSGAWSYIKFRGPSYEFKSASDVTGALIGTLNQFNDYNVDYDCMGNIAWGRCKGTINIMLSYCGGCGQGQYRSAHCTYAADRTCSNCPGHQWGNGGDNCYSCTAGQYLNGWNGYGYTGCQWCPAGQYGTNGRNCAACPLGQYQNQIGQTSCKNCDPGFEPSADRKSCVPCQNGEFRLGGNYNGGFCQACTNSRTCGFDANFQDCSRVVDTTCATCNPYSRKSNSYHYKRYPMSMLPVDGLDFLVTYSQGTKNINECKTLCSSNELCSAFVMRNGWCVGTLKSPLGRNLAGGKTLWVHSLTDTEQTQVFRRLDSTRESANAPEVDLHVNDCDVNPCDSKGTYADACLAFGECVCKPGFIGSRCEFETKNHNVVAECETIASEISQQLKDFETSCPCGMVRSDSECVALESFSEKRVELGKKSLACLKHYEATSVLRNDVAVGSKYRSLGLSTKCFQTATQYEAFPDIESEIECFHLADERARIAFEFVQSGPSKGCRIAAATIETFVPFTGTDATTGCYVRGFRTGPNGSPAVTRHAYAGIFRQLAQDCTAPYPQMPFNSNQTNHQARGRLEVDVDEQSSLGFFFSHYLGPQKNSICDIICPCGKYPLHGTDVQCQGTIRNPKEGLEHARATSKCAWAINWDEMETRNKGITFLLQTMNCLVEYVAASESGVRDPIVADAIEEVSTGVAQARNRLRSNFLESNLLARWEGSKVDMVSSNGDRQVLPSNFKVTDVGEMSQDVSVFTNAIARVQSLLNNPDQDIILFKSKLAVDIPNIDLRSNKIISNIADNFVAQTIEEYIPALEKAHLRLLETRDAVESQIETFVEDFVVAIFKDREVDRLHKIFEASFAVVDMYYTMIVVGTEIVSELTDGELDSLDINPVNAPLSSAPLAKYIQIFEDWSVFQPKFEDIVTKIVIASGTLQNLTILESRGFKDVLNDLGEDYEGYKTTLFDLANMSLQAMVAHIQSVKLLLDKNSANVVPWLDRRALGHLWDMFRFQITGLFTKTVPICPLPGNKRGGTRVAARVTGGRLLAFDDRESFEDFMRDDCGLLNNAFIEFALRAGQIQSALVQQVWKVQAQFRQGSVVAAQNNHDEWEMHLDTFPVPNSLTFSGHVRSIYVDRVLQTETSLLRFLGEVCQAAKYLLPFESFNLVNSELDYDSERCQFSHPKQQFTTQPALRTYTLEFSPTVSGKDCSLNFCEVVLLMNNGDKIQVTSATQEREMINAAYVLDGNPATCTNAARTLVLKVEISDIRKLKTIQTVGDVRGDGWTQSVDIKIDGKKVGTIPSNCGKSTCNTVLTNFAMLPSEVVGIENHDIRFGRIKNTLANIVAHWLPLIDAAVSGRQPGMVQSACSTGLFTKPLDLRGDSVLVDVVYDSFPTCITNADLYAMEIFLKDREGNILPPPGEPPIHLTMSLLKPATFYRYVQSDGQTLMENSFVLPDSDLKFEFEYRTLFGENDSCQPGETKMTQTFGNSTSVFICYSTRTKLRKEQFILPSPMTSWTVTLDSFYASDLSKPFQAYLQFHVSGTSCTGDLQSSTVHYSSPRGFFNTPGTNSEAINFGGHVCGGRSFDVKYVPPTGDGNNQSGDGSQGENQAWVMPVAAGLGAALVVALSATGVYVHNKKKREATKLFAHANVDGPPVGKVIEEDNPLYQNA